MNATLKANLLAGAAALLAMLVAFLVFSGTDDTAGESSSLEQPSSASSDTTLSVRFSELPTVLLGDLPLEAKDTLELIDDGGPYPYRQDDGVFQNREGILPDHDRGHYREYTVDTPASNDRGARRIVAGTDGERFYTADHYDSFSEIVE